jgi:hypothetical protein
MWRVALVLLALFATGAQQLVAQTHWHSTTVASDAGPGSPKEGSGKHDDCLWCHIAAHAPAAAPPTSIQVPVALDAWAIHVPFELHAVAIPAPAHAWQSRGPPTI